MLAFEAQSRGLSARCLRFAARLTTEPRKTRLRLVANLCRTGLGTRRVTFKVSATYMASSLAKLAWRNSNSNSSSARTNALHRARLRDATPGR